MVRLEKYKNVKIDQVPEEKNNIKHDINLSEFTLLYKKEKITEILEKSTNNFTNYDNVYMIEGTTADNYLIYNSNGLTFKQYKKVFKPKYIFIISKYQNCYNSIHDIILSNDHKKAEKFYNDYLKIED